MTHKAKMKLKAMTHKTWVRLVLLLIIIGTSTIVIESTRAGRLAVVSLSAVLYRALDVIVDMVSDRLFPDEII
jgi:hypothetical protein